MKSDRRHDLQTNELSVHLQKFNDYVQGHASTILAVAIGAILIVAALAYRNHAATRAGEQGWAEYYDVLFNMDTSTPQLVMDRVRALESISETYSGRQLEMEVGRAIVDLCLREAPKAEEDAQRTEFLDAAERHASALLASAKNYKTLQGSAINWLIAIEENRFGIDQNLAHKAKAKEYLDRLAGAEFVGMTGIQGDALERLNDFDTLWEPVVLADPPPPPPTPVPTPTPTQDTTSEEPPGITPIELGDDAAPATPDAAVPPADAAGDPPPASDSDGATADPPSDQPND